MNRSSIALTNICKKNCSLFNGRYFYDTHFHLLALYWQRSRLLKLATEKLIVNIFKTIWNEWLTYHECLETINFVYFVKNNMIHNSLDPFIATTFYSDLNYCCAQYWQQSIWKFTNSTKMLKLNTPGSEQIVSIANIQYW